MNNKIVNIVSFQLAYNYGSVLQSFALKQMIERLGYDVQHITPRPVGFELITFNWAYKGSERIRSSFDQFRKQNFPHSSHLYNEDGKILDFNDSDIFVVGSDQVWNLRYSGEQYREFFLNFVPEKNRRIAYAPSFGGTKLEASNDVLSEINTYLQKFQTISCRENTGVNYLKNEFGINASKVLDPTLLEIDYSSLFNPDKYPAEGDELVFFGLGSERLEQYTWIRYIGKNADLKVRVINGIEADEEFLYSHYVSPDEWLSRLYNSSMIVTSSFHAMAFAIIFKKPFVARPRSVNNTANENEQSRYIDLLSDLGLEDRYFSSLEEIQSDHRWKNPIDYEKVYEKLSALKEYSLNFLKQSLEN
jgi:Polysaccharide pyruvyl transferase.